LRRASTIASARASSSSFDALETVKLMLPMSLAPAAVTASITPAILLMSRSLTVTRLVAR
jgi:hypothetical protein